MTPEEKMSLGYQSSIALINYEGQLIWRAFATLMSANSALVAITGAAMKLFPDLGKFAILLSVLGMFVCVAWFFVLRRHFAYYRYWFAWARHFEEHCLVPEVQMTIAGKTYGEGGTVPGNSHVPNLARFSWTARTFRVEWVLVLVILIFLLLYVLLLTQAI